MQPDCLAGDTCFDFGYPGIMVVMFVLGWLGRYLQQESRLHASVTYSTLYVTYICQIILVCRYSVFSVVNPILTSLFVVFIVSKTLSVSRDLYNRRPIRTYSWGYAGHQAQA
jgi:hypothetical protein